MIRHVFAAAVFFAASAVCSGQAHATDYCGPEARSIFSKEMFLSMIAFEVEFNRACELHDKCYREGAAKVVTNMRRENSHADKKASFDDLVKLPKVATKMREEQAYCDDRFKQNATRACEKLNPVRASYCKGVDAKLYPWYVRTYGRNWFLRAVKEKYAS